MSLLLNKPLVQCVTLSSRRLVQLTCLAHPVKAEGSYLGRVFLQGNKVGSFRILASGPADEGNAQINVDLAQFSTPSLGPAQNMSAQRMGCPGYLLLWVSSGEGGYRVTLDKLGDDAARTVFDSESLMNGDIFTATLIKPGQHGFTDKGSGVSGTITVAKPTAQAELLEPGEPVMVKVAQNSVSPKKIKITPGQTVAFNVASRSGTSIEINLESTTGDRMAPTPRIIRSTTARR